MSYYEYMSSAPADLLRAANLRVTAPRLAVLAEVEARPHSTADTITQAVHERLGTVSVQSIYGVLHALTDARILRRIEPDGSPGRFELFRDDNHHHVVCRTCGDINDVACTVGHAPCLAANDDHGYDIDTAEVIYWGTCPSCTKQISQQQPVS